MPIHDWARVEAGIFHDFHHAWIEEIKRALNNGLLPGDYYALAEQFAAGFGPDVLTLQGTGNGDGRDVPPPLPSGGGTALLLAPPKVQPTAETALDFYRRKQNSIVVRHVSGDRIVAMVEVISPGNKASRHGVRSLVEKAAQLLDRQVHLLFLDLNPPGPRDPNGIHALIWDEMAGQEYAAPPGRPLTLVAYECALTLRAYVEPAAVSGVLPDMPLFLEPGGCVNVPLDGTYQTAFAAVPRRWRSVLERPAPP
jgi:Protein of unknown function (DUF4058)